MTDTIIYTTDSEEHNDNVNPQLNQLDEITKWEIEQEIMDSWDLYDRIHGE